MSVQIFLPIEHLVTAMNITNELSVRQRVTFNIVQLVCGVIATLMPTSLELVLYTITPTDVASFTVTGKSFTTFGTLKRLMTPLVVVEGPPPLQNLSTLLAGVLPFVKMGLILVFDKFLLAAALLWAHVTDECLLLLNLKRVNFNLIIHDTMNFQNKMFDIQIYTFIGKPLIFWKTKIETKVLNPI